MLMPTKNRLNNTTTFKVGPATFSVRFNLMELGTNLINQVLAKGVNQESNSKTIDLPTTITKNTKKAKTKQ
jgi:hypothetical protein